MPRAEEEAVRQDRELIRVRPALRYFAVGPRHNAGKLSTCPATCSSAAGASSSDVGPKAVTQVAMRFEDRHSFLLLRCCGVISDRRATSDTIAPGAYDFRNESLVASAPPSSHPNPDVDTAPRFEAMRTDLPKSVSSTTTMLKAWSRG
jgi:hypothetical protein